MKGVRSMVFSQQDLDEWQQRYPLLNEVMNLNPVLWVNPNIKSMKDLPKLPIDKSDIENAEQLWRRFAPFLAKKFPETKKTDGVIESPLRKIATMKSEIEKEYSSFSGEVGS